MYTLDDDLKAVLIHALCNGKVPRSVHTQFYEQKVCQHRQSVHANPRHSQSQSHKKFEKTEQRHICVTEGTIRRTCRLHSSQASTSTCWEVTTVYYSLLHDPSQSVK